MSEIKSDFMTDKVDSFINGSAGFVIFFGVFTVFCIIFQCLDLIIDRYYSYSIIFNKNFTLPMDILTGLYASLCCVYIGVDRTTSIIATFKGSKDTMNYGNPERNRHIIIQNFFITLTAIILYRFFDVNLGIESLIISFGGAVILYVSGQKFIVQASKFAPAIDKNKNGIDDRLENDKELLSILNDSIDNNKTLYLMDNEKNVLYVLNENKIIQI